MISTGRKKGGLCSGGIVEGEGRDGLHSCESGRVDQSIFSSTIGLLVYGLGAWGGCLADSASRWSLWCSCTKPHYPADNYKGRIVFLTSLTTVL